MSSANDWSCWPAPAKLNLFLHVLGRRSDGYHEIQTLFQLLDWGDEIRLQPTGDGKITRGEAAYPVAGDDDLVVRAARLLQAETDCRAGVRIEVHKAIPLGSGLGGGSSDAATVLVALNHLWGCSLSSAELVRLGARLGADIPVFVHGRTALAEGIGDRLEPVELGPRHYVLVMPGLPIPTADLFGDPALNRDSRPIGPAEAVAGQGHNDFEPLVRMRYPQMEKALTLLARWGRARITGTGSGIFLEMPGATEAQSAADEMKSLYNVRAVGGVDRSPLLQRLAADGQ
jgi:4-diphosphocytidyl-2-C-methyl-D-erythritol kinase